MSITNQAKFILLNDAIKTNCLQAIGRIEFDTPMSVEIKPHKNTRSLPQNATFHMWVQEISGYLIARGKQAWGTDFTKTNLKHTFLGYDMIETVDVTTGEFKRKSQLRHTSGLDTGEMYFFMQQVEQWAAGIGCLVTIPHNSVYQQLKAREVA